MSAQIVNIQERTLDGRLSSILLSLSADWETEGSCWGYRKNTAEDLENRRVWTAEQNGRVIGYLFGLMETSKRSSSVMPESTPYFEIEEIYVCPEERNQQIGKRLFQAAEEDLRQEGQAAFVMLSTATKNWKAILHFYLDELDMTFWNARLFKPLR